MSKEKLTFVVTTLVTTTLCIVVLSMVMTLMTGLFDEKVDNSKIFEMLMPAFQTIVGGFIGLITGIKIGSNQQK